MDLRALLAQQLPALGISLGCEQQARLLDFQRELLAWNRKFNLTAIRDPVQSIEKHLVDSLTALPLLADTATLLDLGSGPGLPAIPLKIARPAMRVVSVEAQEKKILFQRHAARTLNLIGFTPLRARIEALAREAEHQRAYAVVIARALADTRQLLDWARPFLADGGRFIAMKAQEDSAQLDALARAAGFHLMLEERLHLPRSGALRRLVVFSRADAPGSP